MRGVQGIEQSASVLGSNLRGVRVAFGPQAPSFGSWRWLGQDAVDAIHGACQSVVFDEVVPDADVVFLIKFKPDASALKALRRRSVLVYCPVDIYGDDREIEADEESLRQFDCIVAHSGDWLSGYRPMVLWCSWTILSSMSCLLLQFAEHQARSCGSVSPIRLSRLFSGRIPTRCRGNFGA